MDANGKMAADASKLPQDPTLEQIEERAALIRAGWSELGRRNRHVMGEYRVRSLTPISIYPQAIGSSEC